MSYDSKCQYFIRTFLSTFQMDVPSVWTSICPCAAHSYRRIGINLLYCINILSWIINAKLFIIRGSIISNSTIILMTKSKNKIYVYDSWCNLPDGMRTPYIRSTVTMRETIIVLKHPMFSG